MTEAERPEPVQTVGPPAPTSDTPRAEMASLLAWISLIVAVCVVLDVYFFNGFFASDDTAYFKGAARVADSGFLGEPDFALTRLTVLGWNLLIGRVTEFNVQAMAGSYIVFHVLLVLLAGLLAHRLFGTRAAILTAWLTATFPLFITFSTTIIPDLIIACLLVLSLLLFLWAYDWRRRRKFLPAVLLMLATGLVIGIAYMAKSSALLALPFYFFTWLIMEIRCVPNEATSGGRVRATVAGAAFAVGFFSMVVIEFATFRHLVGESYNRMKWAADEEDIEQNENFRIHGGYNPVDRLVAANTALHRDHVPAALKCAFLAGLLVYPFLRRRNWPVYFLGLWYFAYLVWGSYNIRHYYPPSLQARYFIPAMAFMIIILSAVLSSLCSTAGRMVRSERIRRPALRTAIVIIMVLPLTWLRGPDRRAGRLYGTPMLRNTARAIRHASRIDERRIIVSDDLAMWIDPIWYEAGPAGPYGQRPTNVITSRELTRADLQEMLAAGGFHYIEQRELVRKPDGRRPASLVDRLMRPAIDNALLVRQDDSEEAGRRAPSAPPIHSTCVEGDGLGSIEISGYTLTLERRSFRRLYKSRSKEFMHRAAGGQRVTSRHFSRGFEPLDLYHVTARPVETLTEEQVGCLVPVDEDSAGDRAASQTRIQAGLAGSTGRN